MIFLWRRPSCKSGHSPYHYNLSIPECPCQSVLPFLLCNQSHSVEDIFIAQRDFIYIATQSQKPSLSSDTFSELLKLTQQALEKVCEYRENNRPSPFFHHL